MRVSVCGLVALGLWASGAEAFSVQPAGFGLSLRAKALSAQGAKGLRVGRLGAQAPRGLRLSPFTLQAVDTLRVERVNVNGNELAYAEEVEGADVGVAQLAVKLTPEKPYYEVTVVDGGTQSWIGVGVADENYPLDKQPGWEQNSAGYHMDDGCLYRAPIPDEMSKSGRPQPMPLVGQPFPCEKGDTMGVGLEFDDRGKEPSLHPRRVYFTKNGEYLGGVLLEKNFHYALHPTIGFNSPGAKVTVNLDAKAADASIIHAAQFFGTSEWAIDIVKDAIADGANVDVKDAAGRTPLHMASAYGATPVAQLLLDEGADPDVQDSMGLSPMHMAAGYVRPSTMRLLIENGADPELRTQRNERALDLIRNMRNATAPSSMGGLVQDKRFPIMTEIVDLLESVTENLEEWVVPEPPKLEPEQEEAMKKAIEDAQKMVEEMKKDPEKMKELEKAMELMKDAEFQEKVKKYASDPEGLKKLMEEYKDKV